MNCETLTCSMAVRQQAIDLMHARAPRSVAYDPMVGDTLMLEGSAVMVLEVGTFGGMNKRVRFRARSGPLRQIWVDTVTEGAWEALVENWLGMGAECVPAESVEQIYPHRERVRVGLTGGVDEVRRFIAEFPASSRPACVSMTGGAA